MDTSTAPPPRRAYRAPVSPIRSLPRPRVTLRALSVDLLVAAVVALYACLLFTGGDGPRDLTDAVMLGVACAALVALRRSAPAALLAVALTLHVIQDITDRHEAYATLMLSIGVFSVVAVTRVWVGATVCAAVTVVYLFSAGHVDLTAAFVGSAAGFFASAEDVPLVVEVRW